MQAAIDYLHGEDIAEEDIAKDGIPLLLVARALGIDRLEERVKKHLTQKLDRQFDLIASEFQIVELAAALRELYSRLSGEVEVGKEVVGVVASATAHACCRKLATLKRSPEFMLLLKEVPQLAYDILASDVEMDGVNHSERNGDVAENGGKEGDVLEVVEDVVTEAIEEVIEGVVEEAVEEIVEETVEGVV